MEHIITEVDYLSLKPKQLRELFNEHKDLSIRLFSRDVIHIKQLVLHGQTEPFIVVRPMKYIPPAFHDPEEDFGYDVLYTLTFSLGELKEVFKEVKVVYNQMKKIHRKNRDELVALEFI